MGVEDHRLPVAPSARSDVQIDLLAPVGRKGTRAMKNINRNSRVKWTSLAAMVGLVLGSFAVGTLASSVQALASSVSPCSPAVGAPFSYKAPGGKQLSGDTYGVLVQNESCSNARTWATKLTHASPGTTTPDGGRRITGGPSGWTCEGKGYTSATRRPPTISGLCYEGKLTNPTKVFYWKPNV